jgi:hypothetical protein
MIKINVVLLLLVSRSLGDITLILLAPLIAIAILHFLWVVLSLVAVLAEILFLRFLLESLI